MLVGCSNYEFNRRTMRFERVGPRSRPQAVSETEEPEVTAAEEVKNGPIPERGYNPKKNMSQKQQTNFAQGEVFRLYLGDESAKSSISGQNLYVLKQASSDKLAELLGWLFVSEGPGGSKRLSFLMYSEEETWSQAKNFAPLLDVGARDLRSSQFAAAADISNWEMAIGLIYGSDFPRQLDSDVRFRATSLLNQVLKDPGEKVEIRWAAGIIASTLQARYQPKDFVAARALLSQTDELVGGQNYRSLVVRYHYINQLMARDQKLTARKQAQDTLNTFQSLSHTDCYQAIRRIVDRK